MSTFGFIERLLDGSDVKWEALKEVTSVTKSIRWQDELSSLHYIDLASVCREKKAITETSKVSASNAPSRAKKLVQKGDVIFATTRPTQQRYCLIDDEYSGHVASTGYCVLRAKREKVLPKWIFYCIASTAFKKYSEENQSGAAYPSISDKQVKEYLIPIPCPENSDKSLKIQTEIVRVLDSLFALTLQLKAELKTELSARKNQYNYYRSQLLSFNEGAEWNNLEDIASFRRGSFPQPYGNSEWYDGEGNMPFVQVADVADFGFKLHQKTKQKISKLAQPKSVFVEEGTVIVSLQGTIGRVAITQYDTYVDRTLAIFTNYKVDVNKKYFAHQLKAKFDLEKEFARGSTLKTITKQEFSKFQIPLPKIEEQDRIVSCLDELDTVIHSIKEALPREIALRQKQYEYYLDLLISFPKLEQKTI
ncbi:restriction endonuclease subunit S [Vibrio sp. T20]|uniref:restriction endonuclease subunit S n=1 Tax=Vibrio sp. T20 TaxID=2588450 RepID=UPI0011B48D90|nr:restriction endonuclease subunit S [Vibrio sp. T20]